jgi:ABC-type transport system involved in cytochrome c biogenesis permease subunit
MKKWFPWILTGLCAAWILASLFPAGEKGFKTREFGKLPVLLNGRVQPMDSVARNALLEIRNKQTVVLENGRKISAAEWLLDVFFNAEAANTQKVFRVDHPELLSLLKLPENEKHFSYNELQSGFDEIDRQSERISAKEASLRTTFEKQTLKLEQSLQLYHSLKNSLQPEDSTNFVAEISAFEKMLPEGVTAIRNEQAGKPYDKEAFSQLIQAINRFDHLLRLAYPLAIPPAAASVPRDNWMNTGAALLEYAKTNGIPAPVRFYAAMGKAWHEGKPDEFNQNVEDYRNWLRQLYTPELSKASKEAGFSQFQPFYKTMVLYVLAFILVCVSWFNLSEWLRRSAQYLIVLAFGLHTFGLVFRMILEGRPPVTNLYSSAIFIGWAAVLLGIILEHFHRDGIGSVTAAAIGFTTQIIAHNLALGGDTMEMLNAVLDTNFWLATHVVTVTLGYAATFVAGFLALIYILRGVFTRTLSEQTATGLERMVYGVVCFALLFSFVGTVLGGIWADQSWGRFWGWDPKENGALIIVLWNAAILHAYCGKMVGARGLMNMAIFGNIVTSFSWFGVNMLGIGLHSYGFMDEAFKWLKIFIASQLVFIIAGLTPLSKWASFKKTGKPAKTPQPAGGR